jgi:hypothetical protein
LHGETFSNGKLPDGVTKTQALSIGKAIACPCCGATAASGKLQATQLVAVGHFSRVEVVCSDCDHSMLFNASGRLTSLGLQS